MTTSTISQPERLIGRAKQEPTPDGYVRLATGAEGFRPGDIIFLPWRYSDGGEGNVAHVVLEVAHEEHGGFRLYLDGRHHTYWLDYGIVAHGLRKGA